MAQFTKEQIVERATELAKMIAETQEVDFFKRAEAQINQNKKFKKLLIASKAYRNKQLIFSILESLKH